ncbi:DUF397 domain-containing protein [Saccharothrix stipae]
MERDTGWFKSSYSSGGSNGCVEVRMTPAFVRVRDSKNPDGPRFRFTSRSWGSFLTGLAQGRRPNSRASDEGASHHRVV